MLLLKNLPSILNLILRPKKLAWILELSVKQESEQEGESKRLQVDSTENKKDKSVELLKRTNWTNPWKDWNKKLETDQNLPVDLTRNYQMYQVSLV